MPRKSPLEKAQARARKFEHQAAVAQDMLRVFTDARLDLEKKLGEAQRELSAEHIKNYRLDAEVATLRLRVKDLEEDVRKERGRVVQALDVAEGAAVAAGSIGRLAHGLSDTVQALNVTVENFNKEERRRR